MHTTNRRDDPHRQAKGEQLGGRPIQMVTALLIVIVVGLNNVAAQIPSRESVRRGHELVPAPAWFKGFTRLGQMFRLYPPDIPTLELKPETEKVRFPARYAVMTVSQMDYQDGQLWILAMDERPMPKTAASAGFDQDEMEEHTGLWRLKGDRLKPELFAPGSMPKSVNSFLLQGDQLWLAGDTVSVWDLKRERLRSFGPAEGLTMKDVEGLTAARGRTFAAGDSFEISFLEPGAGRWVPAERPPRSDKLSHGTGCPYRLAGGEQVLGYQAGGLFFFDFREQRWTNLKTPGDAACLVQDDEKFWIGAGDGLRQYDPVAQTVRTWTSPSYIESELMSVGSHSSGHETVQRQEVDYIDSLIRSQLRKTSRAHWRVRLARVTENQAPDPVGFNSRIPGGVGAIAKDGDYLWVGVNSQHGSRLLLLHKLTESLVASLRMQGTGTISSLAVSGDHVWVGTSYGDDVLLRVSKGAFLAVPRTEWKGLGFGATEQEQILHGMSRRDQALYAFYAGEDERVRDLLGGVDPGKASLEEMFLLGWSCDPLGADHAQECAAWFERICERHPDSPWSRAAMQFSATNQALYGRFDLNKDGRLEASEKRVMFKDEDALGFPKPWEFRESDLHQLFSAADQDGDQRLNPIEFTALWNWIPAYFDVGGPLGLVRLRFQVDANKDSHLDASEFKNVISEVRRLTEQRRKRQPMGSVPE